MVNLGWSVCASVDDFRASGLRSAAKCSDARPKLASEDVGYGDAGDGVAAPVCTMRTRGTLAAVKRAASLRHST
jgi:hypothetical protein